MAEDVTDSDLKIHKREQRRNEKGEKRKKESVNQVQLGCEGFLGCQTSFKFYSSHNVLHNLFFNKILVELMSEHEV